MFYEQTDDTRDMKEVILSADGDLSLYLVPADVADNLATVANEFASGYVWHGEKSGKFLKLCGEQYGAVFDEADFIEYLNTWVFPDQPSVFVKNIGWTQYGRKLPTEYQGYPWFHF